MGWLGSIFESTCRRRRTTSMSHSNRTRPHTTTHPPQTDSACTAPYTHTSTRPPADRLFAFSCSSSPNGRSDRASSPSSFFCRRHAHQPASTALVKAAGRTPTGRHIYAGPLHARRRRCCLADFGSRLGTASVACPPMRPAPFRFHTHTHTHANPSDLPNHHSYKHSHVVEARQEERQAPVQR